MKISRIIKTVFMADFAAGLLIAIKKIFKSKKTINYPFEKGKISPRFRGEHALRRYENGRKIFQPNLINWSKRYLGTIALIRENKIKSPKILNIIQKAPGNKLNG